MVDPIKVLREWLLGVTAVTSLLGTNAAGSIYGGGDLPEHFDPNLGAGIQIFVSGGPVHPEIPPYIMPRLTIKVVAGVEEYVLARQIFGAVFDALHGKTNVSFGSDGTVLSAQAGGSGRDMTDPETGWVIVYEFFSVQMI